MEDKFNRIRTINIIKNLSEEKIEFGMTLYLLRPPEEKNVSWNCLLREFETEEVSSLSNPKSIARS